MSRHRDGWRRLRCSRSSRSCSPPVAAGAVRHSRPAPVPPRRPRTAAPPPHRAPLRRQLRVRRRRGPEAAPPQHPQPLRASAATASSYPETGEAPCGDGAYTGNFKKITAPDAKTVVFQFCNPNVAFLSKVAFSAFGIHDSDYLDRPRGRTSLLDQPNGTGPTSSSEWTAATGSSSRPTRATGASDAAHAEPRVPLERPRPRSAWSSCSRAPSTASTTRARTTSPAIEGDTDLDALPARGPQHLLPRASTTLSRPGTTRTSARRSRMGIDRQRDRRQLLPAGLRGRDATSRPCAIPFGCEGEADVGRSTSTAAKALLAEAGFAGRLRRPRSSYRAAVRGYLPDPPVDRAGDRQPARDEPRHRRRRSRSRSRGRSSTTTPRARSTACSCSAGAPTIRTPPTSSTTTSARAPATKFGDPFPDLVAALTDRRPDGRRGRARAGLHRGQRPHQASTCRRSSSPTAAPATAFKADVEGAHSSPLSNESSRS